MKGNFNRTCKRAAAGLLALLFLAFRLPAFADETDRQEPEQEPEGNFALLPESIPVQQYEGGQYQVDVYGSFTQLEDEKGEVSVVEDNRLLMKRGNMIPVSTDMDYLGGKVDQIVVDAINGGNGDAQYLSVLEENRRVEDYYERLKWPEELSNAGIREISSNLNTSDTVLMVRYTDDTVAAFNYLTGTLLFIDESEKKPLGFGEYVGNWITETWNNLFGPNTVDYDDIVFLKGELEKKPLDTELNGNSAGNGQNLSSGDQVYNKDGNGLNGSVNTGPGTAIGDQPPVQTGVDGKGSGAVDETGGIRRDGFSTGQEAAPNGAPALNGQAPDGQAGEKGPQNAESDPGASSVGDSAAVPGVPGRDPVSDVQDNTTAQGVQNGAVLSAGQNGMASSGSGDDPQALEKHMLASSLINRLDPAELPKDGELTEEFLITRLPELADTLLSDGQKAGGTLHEDTLSQQQKQELADRLEQILAGSKNSAGKTAVGSTGPAEGDTGELAVDPAGTKAGDIGESAVDPAGQTEGNIGESAVDPAGTKAGDIGESVVDPAGLTEGDAGESVVDPAGQPEGDTGESAVGPAGLAEGDTGESAVGPAGLAKGDVGEFTGALAGLTGGDINELTSVLAGLTDGDTAELAGILAELADRDPEGLTDILAGLTDRDADELADLLAGSEGSKEAMEDRIHEILTEQEAAGDEADGFGPESPGEEKEQAGAENSVNEDAAEEQEPVEESAGSEDETDQDSDSVLKASGDSTGENSDGGSPEDADQVVNGDEEQAGGQAEGKGSGSGLAEAKLDTLLTVYNPDTEKYELYDTGEYLSQGGTKGGVLSISQKMENMGGRSAGSSGVFEDMPEWTGYMVLFIVIMFAALFFLKRQIDKKLQL